METIMVPRIKLSVDEQKVAINWLHALEQELFDHQHTMDPETLKDKRDRLELLKKLIHI